MIKGKIQVAVVGAGFWGRSMCNFIIESGVFNIKYIFDPDSSNIRQYMEGLQCTYVNDIKILLDDKEVEAVFIFSPNFMHMEQAILCAEAKKHIFIEKPVSNTVEESIRIKEACIRNNVHIFVGHNVRYYNIFRKAKEIIDSGEIGEIVFIESNRSRPIGCNINNTHWRYYKEKCNGGPLIQLAIHLFDTVRYICGLNAQEIMAIGVKKFLTHENDESLSAVFNINDRQLFNVFTSYVSQESFYINFFGTKKSLFVDPFNGLFIQDEGTYRKREVTYIINSPEVEEITAFYNLINNDAGITSNIDDAIENVAILEEILRCR